MSGNVQCRCWEDKMEIYFKQKLEQKQQICLLYCLKTFKNYKVTIFMGERVSK